MAKLEATAPHLRIPVHRRRRRGHCLLEMAAERYNRSEPVNPSLVLPLVAGQAASPAASLS